MLWEMALCHLALGQWRESAECWGAMKETAKWSKVNLEFPRFTCRGLSLEIMQAIYAYGKAACLLQTGNLTDTEQEEADKLMKEVPQLLQRIAGKSIPLEVSEMKSGYQFNVDVIACVRNMSQERPSVTSRGRS